ncbi:MAG: hypothetical protein ACOC10_08390 [Bacteroidota bacterium]
MQFSQNALFLVLQLLFHKTNYEIPIDMDKKQKLRTCPHCGYRYSILDFYNQFALSVKDNKYYCMYCQEPFTIELNRRTKNVFITAFLGALSGAYLATLENSLWQMGALVLIILLALIGVTYDKFMKLPN